MPRASRNRIMPLTSQRKLLRLAVIGTGCLVLVLRLSLTNSQPQTPDLRIAGQPQTTNGTMFISIVLSNGSSRTLNIVDDGMGKPFMVLDADTRSNMPGTIGFGLGVLANTLKLNLAPGAFLTNTVQLTNPPTRFRLIVEVRDLSAERGRAPIELFDYLLSKIMHRRPVSHYSTPLARSPWIVNGTVSNMTPTASFAP